MKKVLASVIIAGLIIGGAVTYSTAHPEKQVTTVANQRENISMDQDSAAVVTNINSDNENININDYMGDWRTGSLIGSLDTQNNINKSQSSNINISQDKFKISTSISNNVVNDITITKPVYKLQKLPDNYFRISFHREPEALGLSAKNNYQVIVNNSPTDIYISNGKLVYNASGSFFYLSK